MVPGAQYESALSIHISPPSQPPIPPLQAIAELLAELPVLHTGFPAAIYFRHGSGYTNMCPRRKCEKKVHFSYTDGNRICWPFQVEEYYKCYKCPSRWRGSSSNHLPVDVWDLDVVNTMLEDILFLTSASWSSIVMITCLFSTGHSRTASFSPLHR